MKIGKTSQHPIDDGRHTEHQVNKTTFVIGCAGKIRAYKEEHSKTQRVFLRTVYERIGTTGARLANDSMKTWLTIYLWNSRDLQSC